MTGLRPGSLFWPSSAVVSPAPEMVRTTLSSAARLAALPCLVRCNSLLAGPRDCPLQESLARIP
jgi:hypothetical protein